MDLTGKKILISGALTDLGRIISSQVSKLGATVFLLDQDESRLQNLSASLPCEVNFQSFDLFNNKEIEPNINEIVKSYGRFHGFAYAAGIGGVRPLSLTKHENMMSMMDANCFSFVEMSRCLIKKKAIEDGGSIVAISSVSSIKGLKSKLAYASSKAAMDASVRCLAAELGFKGIRVNSILKGGMSSDNNLDYIKSIVELNKNETKIKQFLGEIDPSEVANLVAFLLSDAIKTMTGTSIILDAGYTL